MYVTGNKGIKIRKVIYGSENINNTVIPTPVLSKPGETEYYQGSRGGKGKKRIGIFWTWLCGGGVETVSRDIAEGLSTDDYIVDGIVWQALPQFMPMTQSFDEFIVLNRPFELIGQLDGGPPFPPIGNADSFQKLITERHYDALILTCCWSPFWVAKAHGIPIIEYWHGFGCWNGWDMPSDYIIAVSAATKDQIFDIRKRKQPVSIINNAVDASKYDYAKTLRKQAREELGLDENAPVMLFCGRFSDEKRPIDAMVTFSKARESIPDLQILMAGTCLDVKGYMRIGESIGLHWGKDAILTTLSHEDIIKAYAAADVMLHPSEFEGLGMVLLEAMSAKVPIVSTCKGGCYALLKNIALEVPVGDTDKQAAAIVRVLQNSKLSTKMTNDGYNRVTKYYSVKQQGNKINKVIRKVLSTR